MTLQCENGPGPGAPRGRGDGESPSASGFTLIEMFVVLAILGFALALVIGYRSPGGRGLDLRGSAANLAAGLRMARSEAILKNRAVSFDLDLAGHRFRAGSGPVHQLPASLGIELLTIDDERRNGHTGTIRFNPDGSSSGGRISIDDGGHTMMVGVDWLTGRVSIADARR
jgi:general secretion pathway protein H